MLDSEYLKKLKSWTDNHKWYSQPFVDIMTQHLWFDELLSIYQFAINNVPNNKCTHIADNSSILHVLYNLWHFDQTLFFVSLIPGRISNTVKAWLLFGDMNERILQSMEVLPNNECKTEKSKRLIQTLITNSYQLGFDDSYWKRMDFCKEQVCSVLSELITISKLGSDANNAIPQADSEASNVILTADTEVGNVIPTADQEAEKSPITDETEQPVTITNTAPHIASTNRGRGRPSLYRAQSLRDVIEAKYCNPQIVKDLYDYIVTTANSFGTDVHKYVLLTVALEKVGLVERLEIGGMKSYVEMMKRSVMPDSFCVNTIRNQYNAHKKKGKEEDIEMVEQYIIKINAISNKDKSPLHCMP